jgi:spore coat polysaccharide biosynthesis protein SpsF (cytidylyltransferase family)
MKNSFLIIISVIVLTSCASKTSFNSFYVENKEECEFSISSPAFLANLIIPKDDVQEYEDLFKKVRHYKVMIFSNTSKDLDKRFNRFIKKKKYESIIRINQDGEQVQLYFLQHKNTIREIVLKVKSDNDYVLLGLKTNISENDLNSIIEKSTYDVSSN